MLELAGTLPGQRQIPGNITISEGPRPHLITPGPLLGLRLIVKDNIDVAGYVTTFGSDAYPVVAATQSAPVTAALTNAGAHVIGKANLDEFAWGVTGENTHWGRIHNPVHPELTTGGSSGGTAAAIAGGFADIGLGTDTAGSVRIPAACCEVVGLRPRSGSLSVTGVHPLAPSFDVVGPMARSAALLRRVWAVLSHEQGPVPPLVRPRLAAMEIPGWAPPPTPHQWGTAAPVTIDRGALDPFWTVMRAEAYLTHRERFEAGAIGYGPAIRAKLTEAKSALDAADAARAELAAHRTVFRRLFDLYHAVLAPALGRSIPRAGADEAAIRAELGWPSALFSALDAAVVCVGGLQIVARDEWTAITLAEQFEAAETPREERQR